MLSQAKHEKVNHATKSMGVNFFFFLSVPQVIDRAIHTRAV